MKTKKTLLKTILLKTLLLSIILTGTTEIAFAQSLTQNDTLNCWCDSLIPYTDKQDKRCLECLINEPKKDSLISLHEVFIKEQSEEIQLLRKNKAMLIRKRKNAFYIGGAVGILVTAITALAVGLSK